MKLITEYTEITETRKHGSDTYIEGIFMQANRGNRNNRVYSEGVLRKAVEEYVETQVKTGRAVGELNHPDSPIVNYKEASHRILSLEWQGDNVVGKALILNTPNGQIVKGLLEGGVQLGVSSRGMGSLGQANSNGLSEVNDDFSLVTIDIVQDPSAPEAFVNGIQEGTEWVKNDKGIWESRSEIIKKTTIETEPINESAVLKDMHSLLSQLIRS